jgi:hypothetical protein
MAKALTYLDEVQARIHGDGLSPLQPIKMPLAERIHIVARLRHREMFCAEDCNVEMIDKLREIGHVIVCPKPVWDVTGIYAWRASVLRRLMLMKYIPDRTTASAIKARMELDGIPDPDIKTQLVGYVDAGVLIKRGNSTNATYELGGSITSPKQVRALQEGKYAQQPPRTAEEIAASESFPIKRGRPSALVSYERRQAKRAALAGPALQEKLDAAVRRGEQRRAECLARKHARKARALAAPERREFLPHDLEPTLIAPELSTEQTDSQPQCIAGTPADPVPLHLAQEHGVSIPTAQAEDSAPVVAPVVEQGSTGVEAGGREDAPQPLGDAGEVGVEPSGDDQKLVVVDVIVEQHIPPTVTGNGYAEVFHATEPAGDAGELPSDHP